MQARGGWRADTSSSSIVGVGRRGWETLAHAQQLVEDLERSRLFYQDVFGLQVINEDEDSAAFGGGDTLLIVRAAAAVVLESCA
jgi:hypothetical protein